MPISYSDMVLSGNGPLPYGTYTVRCTKAELGTTGKGDQCIKTHFEIVGPPIIEVNGRQQSIAGRKFWPGPQKLDPSDGRNGIGAFLEKVKRAGFDMALISTEDGSAFDESKVPALAGLVCDMTLQTTEQFKVRPPTADEIAAGVDPRSKIELTDGAGDKISNGYRINAWLTDIVGPPTNEGL